MSALAILTPEVVRTETADGFVLEARTPLPNGVATIPDWLDHWATVAPERTFLAERDESIHSLQTALEARSNALRKAPHEDPDCAALDRMPLCPRIAAGLWPAAPASGAGDGHAH